MCECAYTDMDMSCNITYGGSMSPEDGSDVLLLPVGFPGQRSLHVFLLHDVCGCVQSVEVEAEDKRRGIYRHMNKQSDRKIRKHTNTQAHGNVPRASRISRTDFSKLRV